MRLVSVLVFIVITQIVSAQQNLVPNPSFEENTECPYNVRQIWKAEPWYSTLGGCDYFHECGTNGFGIPINRRGEEYARTGQAYSQFTSWTLTVSNARELVGVELSDTLVINARYSIEFYISVQDSMHYAVKNVGIHFSKTPHVADIDSILSLQPQVEYTGSEFLSEKEGWTKIEGSFIAQGGEKYIAIGNFDSDDKTDTLFVAGGGNPVGHPPGHYAVSAYYIDDVSVTLDTTYNAVIEPQKTKLNLYPNPNDGQMYLEYIGVKGNAIFEMYDITGRKATSYNLNGESGKLNIYERELEKGIYLFRIVEGETTYETGKVVIQH